MSFIKIHTNHHVMKFHCNFSITRGKRALATMTSRAPPHVVLAKAGTQFLRTAGLPPRRLPAHAASLLGKMGFPRAREVIAGNASNDGSTFGGVVVASLIRREKPRSSAPGY